MASVFVTGSADGLGLLAAQQLLAQGHTVTLHARSPERARATQRAAPNAAKVVVGDVTNLEGMRTAARQANDLGRFDAVIHNVGIGYREPQRSETVDGLSQIFAVNVLAPYVLTALMHRPARLIYLSSGLHRRGRVDLSDPQWTGRRWDGLQAYSDSKLFDVWLAFGVARRWPNVLSNALEPGWVPTRMGGSDAPDDLAQGGETQAWLAVSDDPLATMTGQYFYHRQRRDPAVITRDAALQDALLDYCAGLAGTALS
jgi:NAD(P)-dependent dehydrogenase (short-subunit alcohol dehydrogenase family)